MKKPPRKNLVPAKPIAKLIHWWKLNNPDKSSEYLERIMDINAHGCVEDFLYTTAIGKRKWIGFNFADKALCAIERPEAWWSPELLEYYESATV